MVVTLANDKYNSYIRREDMTWEDFVERAEYAPFRQRKGTDAIIAGECEWEDGYAVRNDTGEVMCERDGTPIPRAVKGTRKVINRCMAILDVENQCEEFIDILEKLIRENDLACLVYTTFSATEEKPRYRVMIPFDKPITPSEFTIITDSFIIDLGVDNIDPCSDRPNQFMFLPVVPELMDSDGDYYIGYYEYKEYKGSPLNTSKRLLHINSDSKYLNFKKREKIEHEYKTDRKKTVNYSENLEYLDSGFRDPRTLNSIVGSWCRKYDVIDVLEEFLGDLYTPKGDKYKWNESKNDAGGIIKDEGQYFCNMHKEAPSAGMNNSYDLVRLELFGGDNAAMYKFAYINLYGEDKWNRKYK